MSLNYSKAGMAADLAALAQEAEHYGIRLPPAGQKMAEAAQAHIDLQARKTTGSILLIP